MLQKMKTGWWSFDLPGYRPYPKVATYSLFSYEGLPPILEKPDDHFDWLKPQPIKEHSLFEYCYPDGSKLDVSKLTSLAAQVGTPFPEPFTAFIHSIELHKRIRSCTDCYLDLADYAVKTRGSHKGHLVHFLSDSQWVGHWYIHIDTQGSHFILASPNPYGFALEDEVENPPLVEIDLQEEDVWFCAPSFTEFIYRFWLENEIWFALAMEERPLNKTEQVYVNYYVGKVE